MYIYIILFICIFLSSFLYKKDDLNIDLRLRKRYCITVASILILLAGLRHGDIGPDTKMYNYIWDDINTILTNTIETDVEIGFFYLMKFFREFTEYQVFLFVVASLSIAPTTFVIYKYSQNVPMSFLLFYSSLLFQVLEFSAQRQAIAFGLIMIAFHFLMKRKLIYYLICFGVAFLFHRSCVIFLPSYWLYNLRFGNNAIRYWGVALAVSFFFSRLLFLFLNSYWRYEYEIFEEGAGGERLFVLNCVITIIGLSQIKKISNYPTIRLPLILFSISSLLWPILNVNPALYRLQYYFDFFIVLYIPNYISIYNKWRYVLVALSGFMMLYFTFVMKTMEGYYPYKFFWE